LKEVIEILRGDRVVTRERLKSDYKGVKVWLDLVEMEGKMI
jgi:hypothetical protein